MNINPHTLLRLAASAALTLSLTLFLAACGGGGTSPPVSSSTYELSGAITGLASGQSLVLLANEKPMTLTQSGGFKVPGAWPTGTSYTVKVGTQPQTETCLVTNGTGIIGESNVVNITVACTENPQTTYSVGGVVSGLNGTLQLVNNSHDVVMVSANGAFTFPTSLFDQAAYNVVLSHPQPDGQTCTITHAAGTIEAANVASVHVACMNEPVPMSSPPAPTYTVGGRLSGLNSGTLVLANGLQSLPLTGNGVFAFPIPVVTGSPYAVTVVTQPAGLKCTVANGMGTVVPNANVTDVSITCAATTYSIGGTLSGLAPGGAVVLQDNGGDNRTLTSNGNFLFETQLANSARYNVTVFTQPTGHTCATKASGSGTVASANIASLQITCAAHASNLGIPAPTRIVYTQLDSSTFVVPTGITSLIVTVTGGGGGGGGNGGPAYGGGGGAIVTSTLSVTPGQNLNLYVGEGGGHSPYGGGGGGSSTVDPGSAQQIIAGGGGGSATAGAGGNGGNPIGGWGGGGNGDSGNGGENGAGGYATCSSGANGNGGDGGYGGGAGYGGNGGYGYGIGGDGSVSGCEPTPTSVGGTAGGGGGGYGGGGGGGGANDGGGGGGGGSVGPAGSTYSVAPYGDGNSNGANGSIVITY